MFTHAAESERIQSLQRRSLDHRFKETVVDPLVAQHTALFIDKHEFAIAANLINIRFRLDQEALHRVGRFQPGAIKAAHVHANLEPFCNDLEFNNLRLGHVNSFNFAPRDANAQGVLERLYFVKVS